MADNRDLGKLVNASGFAFQVAVEHAIRGNRSHSWHVISREHPWSTEKSQGFIDLVLGMGLATAVVECKRTRDAIWIFLVPTGENTAKRLTRVHWTACAEAGHSLAGTDAIECGPASHVSAFCAVRGSGENDRPLLERICSTLVSSAAALAGEEVTILGRSKRGWKGFYLPIIVTNAELHVCHFDPSEVDLRTGDLGASEYEVVPYMRFQKSFSQTDGGDASANTLEEAAAAHEHTVFVANASYLNAFLADVEFKRFSGPRPWDKALAAAAGGPA